MNKARRQGKEMPVPASLLLPSNINALGSLTKTIKLLKPHLDLSIMWTFLRRTVPANVDSAPWFQFLQPTNRVLNVVLSAFKHANRHRELSLPRRFPKLSRSSLTINSARVSPEPVLGTPVLASKYTDK